MLRSTADFQQIQSQSQSRAHPMLLVRFRRNGLDRTRFGISTGRRIGGAVVRNRIRWRLR
jgi:ribonuclease P protein component